MISRALIAVVVAFGVPIAIVLIATFWEVVNFLLFIVSPCCHHITEFRDSLGALPAEIPKDEAVGQALVEAVDDVLVTDVDDGGALLKEMSHVVPQGFVPALFTLR